MCRLFQFSYFVQRIFNHYRIAVFIFSTLILAPVLNGCICKSQHNVACVFNRTGISPAFKFCGSCFVACPVVCHYQKNNCIILHCIIFQPFYGVFHAFNCIFFLRVYQLQVVYANNRCRASLLFYMLHFNVHYHHNFINPVGYAFRIVNKPWCDLLPVHPCSVFNCFFLSVVPFIATQYIQGA